MVVSLFVSFTGSMLPLLFIVPHPEPDVVPDLHWILDRCVVNELSKATHPVTEKRGLRPGFTAF